MEHQRCPMLVETDDLADPKPRLEGDMQVDVCIVGGGYLGLWTAIRLLDEKPSLSIAIVEADICGGGASGRNSGMALAYWPKIDALIGLCGENEALRLCDESQAMIDNIDVFSRSAGFDIEFNRVGWLWGSTCSRHDNRWTPTIEALDRHGLHPFEMLDRPAIQSHGAVDGLRCGAFDNSAATIQPAKLVRGLRRTAIQRGVTIFERTPMTKLVRSGPPVVETPYGRITAHKVALAMNAWATQIPELSKGIFVITSDDAITAPVPDILDRQRWRSGPIITNSNTFVSGFRTTRDGRIVGGVTGGAIPFGQLTRERYDGPSPRKNDIADALKLNFGTGLDVPFIQSWRGPIDRTRTGLPIFGRLGDRDDIIFGYGFSGNGIVGCRLGSEIVRSLVLGMDDAWSRSGLVRPVDKWMPPEPLRFIGAHMVRNAVRQQDQLDHENKNQNPVPRFLASLAPGGIVTK